MAAYWPSPFHACLWTKTESRSNNNLDRTSLVNKGFIVWLSGKVFLRDAAGKIAVAVQSLEVLVIMWCTTPTVLSVLYHLQR